MHHLRVNLTAAPSTIGEQSWQSAAQLWQLGRPAPARAWALRRCVISERSGVCWLRIHDERKIAKRPGFVSSFPGSQHHQDKV